MERGCRCSRDGDRGMVHQPTDAGFSGRETPTVRTQPRRRQQLINRVQPPGQSSGGRRPLSELPGRSVVVAAAAVVIVVAQPPPSCALECFFILSTQPWEAATAAAATGFFVFPTHKTENIILLIETRCACAAATTHRDRQLFR